MTANASLLKQAAVAVQLKMDLWHLVDDGAVALHDPDSACEGISNSATPCEV
jgi:hypothetical protein